MRVFSFDDIPVVGHTPILPMSYHSLYTVCPTKDLHKEDIKPPCNDLAGRNRSYIR